MTRRCLLTLGFSAASLLLAAVSARAAEPTPEQLEFFEKKVRPIFVEHCFACHSKKAAKLKAGLYLDSRARILKGGDNGTLFEPGKPENSRLLEALNYQNANLQMPKKGKLPDAVIADITAWVKMGAPLPPDTAAVVDDKPTFDLQKRKRDHWAWQPISCPEPPAVQNKTWATNPLDAFILAKLEAKNLTPAPAADKRTLLRRVTFDLIGLPPTPTEVDAFLKDDARDAYEKVVDRLLASPHFGERWGRHWLDLVRYAESRGHEFDYTIPNAHHYRDYVIRALNADLPYNQFVTEHLAGDLLDKPRLHPTEEFNESILGTGFWFLGEEIHSPVDIRQDQADRFDNRIDVLGKTFLGLTVACARCHDHKFDAISTTDYYSLYGFLESTNYRQVRFDTWENQRQTAGDLAALRDQSGRTLQRSVAEAVRPLTETMAAYLLAAREGIQAGPEFATQSKEGDKGKPAQVEAFSEVYRDKLQEIAKKRKLDAEVLALWVAALLNAAKEPGDLLHPWAQAATVPGAQEPKRLAELLQPLTDNLRQLDEAATAKNFETIIDYTHCDSNQWLPDDVSFGNGPTRPGQVRVSGTPAKPDVRLLDYAAAEFDPIWDNLKVAPGTEADAGAIGQRCRAGRTIRTPDFKLSAGKLYYLVRGAGLAYAAVDGHSIIHGPLHGQLVTTFPASPGFRWVAHDLTPYKGQYAHVEFTATPGSNFAVARVLQGGEPPDFGEKPNHALLNLLSADKEWSLETLAAKYQQSFADALTRVQADTLPDAAAAIDDARFVNWLLTKPELFAKGNDTARKSLTDTASTYLTAQQKLAARIKPESRLALAIQDGTGIDAQVFIRGQWKSPGAPAPRRFLEALAGPEPLPVAHGSGRLELARQITDPKLNPLVTRVLVNRIWHHLFGRGIVASVDNFGVLGELPTHPELLDYLADHFARDGWSIKKTIRQVVLSSTYRMSSQSPEQVDQADPQDLLLHRMRVRRLEGEAVRDSMLTVSGRLDRKLYGPSVLVHLTPFLDGRGRPASGPIDGDGRRSIYVAVRRNFLSPLLLAFDTPSPFSTMGRRTVSNVPAQALILLNDPFVHQQAEVWAQRVLAQEGTSQERVAGMYLAAFSRSPTDSELKNCLDFLEQQGKLAGKKADDPGVWADLAHVLFNVKEFIFLN